MPIQLTHDNVRDLAKKLRELTGREIRHTEIIAAIAEAVGRRPDAMMHELKNQKAPTTRTDRGNTSKVSRAIAAETGFEVWDTGGGCLAFARLLREQKVSDGDVASLDVMVTTNGGTSIEAGPDDRVWFAGVNYQDPRGGETVLGGGDGDQTLHEALATALVYSREAKRLWEENYDEAAIASFLSRRSPSNGVGY
jgi:hypothetical protein